MNETEPEIRLRPAARILVLNSARQVLLFDATLAYTRAWITPGGGLEPGETYEEAALRELEEETGLHEPVFSPCIWTLDFRFAYKGVIYDQRERYFAVEIDAHSVRTDGWTESEATEIQRFHWWSLEEILASADNFRPANLDVLLPAILAGDYPKIPIPVLVERGARTV